MPSSKLGIFPAAGGLGGSTIKHLLPRIPPASLVLIARYPDQLAAESAAGCVVRRADYDEEATLHRAFDGVGALFLISYASCEDEYRAEVRSLYRGYRMVMTKADDFRHTDAPSTPPSAAASSTSSTPRSPSPAT